MKKGFTILELIVVIVIMGILGGIGISQYGATITKAQALKIAGVFEKSEYAYTVGLKEVKYSLPAFTGDQMKCFSFQGGANMTTDNMGIISDGIDGTSGNLPAGNEAIRGIKGIPNQTISNMYRAMDRTVRTTLIEYLQFKSSENEEAGLHLPDNPMNKIFLCGRRNMTFMVITNVKGDLAANVVKQLNGGAVSQADGSSGNRRAAAWMPVADGENLYTKDFETYIKTNKATIEDTLVDGAAPNEGDEKFPYATEDSIKAEPRVTLTYLLSGDVNKQGWSK